MTTKQFGKVEFQPSPIVIASCLFIVVLQFFNSCSRNDEDSEIFIFAQNCPILEIIDSMPDSPYVKYVSFRYENNILTGYDYKVYSTDTIINIVYYFTYSNDLLTTIKGFNRLDPSKKQWDSTTSTINRINNDEINIHSSTSGDLGISVSELQLSGNRILFENSDHVAYLDKSQNIVKEEFFTGGSAIPYIARLYDYDQKPSPLYNFPIEAKIGMDNLFGFPGSCGLTNNIIQCTNIIKDEKIVVNYNFEYSDNGYPVKNHSKFGVLSFYYGNCY